MAMPTWEAPGATVLKKTRSPGATASGPTGWPEHIARRPSAACRGPAGRRRRRRSRCSRSRTGSLPPFRYGAPRRRQRRPDHGWTIDRAQGGRLGAGRQAGLGGRGDGRRKRGRHGATRCAPCGQGHQEKQQRAAHDGLAIGGRRSWCYAARCAPLRVARRLVCSRNWRMWRSSAVYSTGWDGGFTGSTRTFGSIGISTAFM